MGPDAANDVDINFCFDPLYPFAEMTGKCARQISARPDYTVAWRFISLRVAVRTRAEHGRKTVK